MDVFVSYSSDDRPLVKEVCHLLKENGISYWVDYENNDFGDSYSSAIVDNLATAKVFLLFVTKHSMKSKHVLREIGLADEGEKQIIPVVVGDVVLSKEFQYYLSTTHMLPYSSSPEFGTKLINRILEILNPNTQAEIKGGTHIHTEEYSPKKGTGNKVIVGVLVALAVAVAAIALYSAFGGGKSAGGTSSYVSSATSSAPTSSMVSTVGGTSSAPQSTPSAPPSTPSNPSGKNQIPSKYDGAIAAFEGEGAAMQNLKTITVAVGGYATPSGLSVWPDATLYSQNTAVALPEGITVKGIAPGQTYLVAKSSAGTIIVYKVIVF